MTRGAGPSPASGLHGGGSGPRGRDRCSFSPGCPCLCVQAAGQPGHRPLVAGRSWVHPGVLRAPGLTLSCCHSQVCFFSLLQAERSRYQDSGVGDPTPSMPSGGKEAQKDLLASPWCKATTGLPSTTHFNPPVASPGPRRDPMSGSPKCLGSSTSRRSPSLLLHPRSRPPTTGPRVDQSPALGGKWQREGRRVGSTEAERRRSEREAGTRARWAKQKQKLSRKRRINSRHHAPRRAYAPQAGNTSTQ